MGFALASACVVIGVFSVSPQTSDQSIAFEAASLKVNVEATNSGGRESISDTPGRLTMRNIRLRSAIAWAFHLQTVRISGPPSLDSVRYDIDATSAGALDREQHRTMLQELLKARFRLAFHSDAQEMPAYVLSVAKGGLKLQESTADVERGNDADGKALINLRGATMEQFAQSIVAPLHSPVVDETGLTGLYDFHLDIAPYLPSGPLDDSILDIPYILSQGMQEQLGLRLESRRTVIEMLVIDHVERPSKN